MVHPSSDQEISAFAGHYVLHFHIASATFAEKQLQNAFKIVVRLPVKITEICVASTPLTDLNVAVRLLRSNILIHDVRPHRQLHPSRHLLSRMQHASMLEYQYPPNLWFDIVTPPRVITPVRVVLGIEESRSATDDLVVWRALVQVEMQREQRELFIVRSAVLAVEMLCSRLTVSVAILNLPECLSQAPEAPTKEPVKAALEHPPLKYSPSVYFKNRILSFSPTALAVSPLSTGP